MVLKIFNINFIDERLRQLNVVVQVLQSVFLKCESVVLGGTILDAVSTIYHGDNANYFLLQVGGGGTNRTEPGV